MKTAERTLLGQAMCDIVRSIGALSISSQSIVEQPSILSGLIE
jgi:hypothetical protein